METGDPSMDDYTREAVGVYRTLSQDRDWIDIDDMSVSYKRNLLSFLAKRATSLGNSYSLGLSMSNLSGGVTSCTGPGGSECSAERTGNEWEHGNFHGSVYPGSEIEAMFEQETIETMRAVQDEPIRWLHSTRLGARLRHDVSNRIGGLID